MELTSSNDPPLKSVANHVKGYHVLHLFMYMYLHVVVFF